LLQFFCIILMHNCNVGGTIWTVFLFLWGIIVGSSLRYHTNY
jgi:hypothetical protein